MMTTLFSLIYPFEIPWRIYTQALLSLNFGQLLECHSDSYSETTREVTCESSNTCV